MATKRLALVALLLLCPAILLAQALPGGRIEERGIAKVYGQDPNSTFKADSVLGVFPQDTVEVPVYFLTSETVTKIENRLFWDTDSLTFVEAVMGSAVPDSASFDVTDMGDSVKYVIGAAPAGFAVPSDKPVAKLRFLVSCYGYGESASVKFCDEDDYNNYITGGLDYAPLREDGKVITAWEGYYDAFVGGTHAFVYTGEDSIPIGIYFRQAVPGRLTGMKLLWDPDKLDMQSISAEPAYIDTFTWSMSGDTMLIDVPESNCILPVDTTVTLFNLIFDLAHCDHNDTDAIDILDAERKDECGGTKSLLPAPGVVHTSNFTAEVDIGDINCYDTAEYYQVYFRMDATHPVNKYEFYVDFPADSLEFDSVVGYGSFRKPGADTTGVNNDILHITSGTPTDYDPSQLPSTVFYIKFKRRYEPTVGQVFDLTFNEDPMNVSSVKYFTDYCGYYDAPALDLLDGSITIKEYTGGGGGGCPTLYVWSGGSFVRENTILAACAGGPVTEDVTDYYMLTNPAKASDNGLKFQIREDGAETSEFSGFRLMVVDHPESEPVRVSPDGNVISLGSLYGVAWARDDKGVDITDLVGVKDNVRYISEESGWFDVSFGKLRPEDISSFISVLNSSQPKDPPPIQRSGAGEEATAGAERKLKVFVKTRNDDWSLLAEQDPRSVTIEQATVIDPDLIDSERELVLRYMWKEYYEIDAVEFHEASEFEGESYALPLLKTSRAESGKMLGAAAASGSAPMVLGPGGVIELVFDASGLRPISRGTVRDYIFVATGKYESAGGEQESPSYRDVLMPNYPNPFNPGTNIRYSISSDGHVDLRIYDVRGALVRTLVSEFQPAGEKTVYWNGLSDGGTSAVSGVYFYRLKTPGFTDTRKMILLR